VNINLQGFQDWLHNVPGGPSAHINNKHKTASLCIITLNLMKFVLLLLKEILGTYEVTL
jgi:hypothetical protein